MTNPFVSNSHSLGGQLAISAATSNATVAPISSPGVNYVNPQTQKVLEGGIEKTETGPAIGYSAINDGIFLMDIAQSHHYTVELEAMRASRLRLPNGTFAPKGFLPVKTMGLKYTSYENMSIPVAIFGDFPLLNKKRVSTIDLTCYDLDDNSLEAELRGWETDCFPKGRFVAYMEDIARKFTYRGYNVKGQNTLTYTVYVIPSGVVSVSRDYSANDAKMITFSLVCVGDGQTCATGGGKEPRNIPIQDHGANVGDNSPFATAYVSGYGTGGTFLHEI